MNGECPGYLGSSGRPTAISTQPKRGRGPHHHVEAAVDWCGCAGVESCDSDTDSCEDEQSSAAVSIDFLSESDQSVSQNTAKQVNARNGTVWKNITGAPGLGRASSSNVFSERPGPTSYCHRSVVNGSFYSGFHLFINEHMLRSIQKHTINHGKKDNDDFDLYVDELESFMGL